MKKIAFIIIGLLVIILITGLFIPKVYESNTTKNIDIAPEAAFRIFGNYQKTAWWPGSKKADSIFVFNDHEFYMKNYLINSINLHTKYNTIHVDYTFSILQANNIQTQLINVVAYQLSANPLLRVWQYFQLNGTKKILDNVFDSCANYFANPEKVYELKIEHQKVKDSALISVADAFDHYPSTRDIYKQVNEIKDYIKQKNGKEVNYPFLNIRQLDSLHWESMVAIATEKQLPATARYKVKKMVLGNILFAIAKGGLWSIQKSEKQLFYYVNDYRKSSPAIPFQSLITDRSAEPDTNKWQTGLYYPVFK